jgi:Glu-tRNA(Gln) amidotransferase subunit E-like FAD-binding protein
MKKKIQDALLKARKEKNVIIADLMRTVLADFDRVSKNPTNEECLKEIKLNFKDTDNEEERAFLNQFLPQLMTKEEIDVIVADIYNSNHFIKVDQWVREWNKRGYKGKADMKLVMASIKESMKLMPY